MTADEAYNEIEILTQATTEPVLLKAELDLLARRAQRADSAGRTPDDNLWTPTFNLAYAVALGWEIKAMKVATGYDFASADQKFSRSQMYAQLMKVAAGWKSRAGESIALQGSLRRNSDLPIVNGDWWPEGWPYYDEWHTWIPQNTSDY